MLDDLKFIHQKDPQDALGVAAKQAAQLTIDFKLEPAPAAGAVDNVVLAGMGGSALGALVAQRWLNLSVPFEIVRGYESPTYLGEGSLFIASSYSGNTEETLAALEKAAQQKAQIAVLAAGGKLVEIAKDKGYPLVLLPQGLQPRYAALASLKALATLLDSHQVTTRKAAELTAASQFVANSAEEWLTTVPTAQNQAKQIAQELMGKSVVVYSGPGLFPAAYKWKININENAKQIAWCNQLPEFNHNEMIGWTEQPVDKPYAVVNLRSNLEHPRVAKRFEVTDRLLSGRRPEATVVQAKGQTLLEQLLWTIALGDFTSLYLALLNDINPTPVELVEKFKQELL